MKKHFVHLIAAAGLVALLAAAAWAQDDETQPAARARIPFDFRAGSTSFSAGVYTFDVDPVTHAVAVEQDSTGLVFFFAGMPASPAAGKSLLTFEKVGGEYQLKELQADVAGVAFAPNKVNDVEAHGTPLNRESQQSH